MTLHKSGIQGNLNISVPYGIPEERKASTINPHLGEPSQIDLKERKGLLNGVGSAAGGDSVNMSQTE